jgi:heme oxygenase (biliverdin-IX-beta and delta-forming)
MQPDGSSSATILHRLRAGTADIHKQVEQRLDIFSTGFDLTCYRRLLERFYGYWAPLELQLCRVEELNHPELELPARLKANLLEADLRVLGAEPALVPLCTRLPELESLGRALGCLYVLEGSTLGSQLIARHIKKRFQLEYGCGASFFNAYGDAVGARWARFRSFLSLHAEAASEDELLSAARETFETLDSWLAHRDFSSR